MQQRYELVPGYTISSVINGCWQLSSEHCLQGRLDYDDALRACLGGNVPQRGVCLSPGDHNFIHIRAHTQRLDHGVAPLDHAVSRAVRAGAAFSFFVQQ